MSKENMTLIGRNADFYDEFHNLGKIARVTPQPLAPWLPQGIDPPPTPRAHSKTAAGL